MASTSKVAGSIDREVRTLVASLDACSAHLKALYPDAGLTVYKVPDRLLLQAGSVGVSVSLFRSRAGMEANTEVIVVVWQGQVTLPGTPPPKGRRAVRVREQQFRLTADGEAAWLWSDEMTMATMTSQGLAAACIETMAQQLRPVMLCRQEETGLVSP